DSQPRPCRSHRCRDTASTASGMWTMQRVAPERQAPRRASPGPESSRRVPRRWTGEQGPRRPRHGMSSMGSPSSRFKPRPPDEAAGDNWHTVDDRQRQRRQSSRCRTVHHPRAVLEIEFREVAGTFDRARYALPVPLVASGMRADRRVRNDRSVCRTRTCLRTEISRFESNEEHLVEPRPVANDLRRRINREGDERRPSKKKVGERDRLALSTATGKDETVIRLRARLTRINVLRACERGAWQT